MLNVDEATAAYKELIYPRPQERDIEEFQAAVREYNDAVFKINREFSEWLASEYASDLPAVVQRRIWHKSWDESHDYGYTEVVLSYLENASFARAVILDNDASRLQRKNR